MVEIYTEDGHDSREESQQQPQPAVIAGGGFVGFAYGLAVFLLFLAAATVAFCTGWNCGVTKVFSVPEVDFWTGGALVIFVCWFVAVPGFLHHMMKR